MLFYSEKTLSLCLPAATHPLCPTVPSCLGHTCAASYSFANWPPSFLFTQIMFRIAVRTMPASVARRSQGKQRADATRALSGHRTFEAAFVRVLNGFQAILEPITRGLIPLSKLKMDTRCYEKLESTTEESLPRSMFLRECRMCL